VEASLIDLRLSDHREVRAKAAAITGAHDQVDSFCVLLERASSSDRFEPAIPTIPVLAFRIRRA
jgi:hypothetical protein